MTREDFWSQTFQSEFAVTRNVVIAGSSADAALAGFDKRDFRPVNLKVLPESGTPGFMALYLNGKFLWRLQEKDGPGLQASIDRILSGKE